MPDKQASAAMFTDAPALRRNVFVGSFQLLFWLFFHPSAWRNHLAEISPDLRPNFCLSDLRWHHWRSLQVWRLLAMTYLAWPLVAGGIIACGLWFFQLPGERVVLGVILGLAVGVMSSFAAGFAGSFVVGTAVGMAISIVIGLAGILVFGSSDSLIFQSPRLSFDLVASTVIGLAGGLAGGLSFGVAAGVGIRERDQGMGYSLPRLAGGVIVGIVIGAVGGRLTNLTSGSVTLGMVIGLPFGVAVLWRTRSWGRSLIAGWLVGVAGSLINLTNISLTASLVEMLALTALLSSLFTVPYILAESIAGPWAGAMAGALGSGGGFFLYVFPNQPFGPILLFSLGGVLLGLTLAWWRPVVMYPLVVGWNYVLYRLDQARLPNGRTSLLRWHSAFWDEFQRLPLLGLNNHLSLVLAYQVELGTAALEQLSSGRQRWAAQEAQIELDAQQLALCDTVAAIAGANQEVAAGELTGPASALLRSFSRISQDVDAALRQESLYNRRLTLSTVEDRLNGLLRELTRSNEPYADRFRPIAADWRLVLADAVQQLADEAELRQEIDSPYVIGVPLTEQQEIFIGRVDISARIEQLLLDRRQPPLLLYGQRRVGKTSLLNNLGRLLPSTTVPLFVDLQGPASQARDDAGFLYNVARGMIRSALRQRDITLPPIDRERLQDDPYTQFDEWLDEIETALGGQRALLMLDEFEVLAGALLKKRFDTDAVLGMLRHIIQHRTRFKVLLSGSHTLDEFQQWAGYLINVQVIHIGYLQADEARQLIAHPVRDFALRYEPEAVERVLALTRGHPFLVQLLCAEVVALKNEQPPAQRRLATVLDVETAVSAALAHGSFFFADIEQNQVDAVGLEVLRLLARHGEGIGAERQELVNFVPSLMALEQALLKLQQRELIEPINEGYRFQVELVRCWFAASAGNR
ncbi:MAG: ATP-binding protein [Chloroflexota bacterium]